MNQKDHNNGLWLADGNGTLVNVSNPVHWGDTEVTVTAYHPYDADWTESQQTFSVQTDQSTDSGYLDSDLLWAKTTSSASDEPVALSFTHKLAKVNVTLTSDDIEDLSNIKFNKKKVQLATLILQLKIQLQIHQTTMMM